MSESRQGPPSWVTVVRDGATLVCAWVIVFKQAGIFFPAPQDVSEPLLWLAGAMIGVPGVGQILALRFGGGQQGDGIGMGGSPSGPQGSPGSGSPSPLSGRSSGGDEGVG